MADVFRLQGSVVARTEGFVRKMTEALTSYTRFGREAERAGQRARSASADVARSNQIISRSLREAADMAERSAQAITRAAQASVQAADVQARAAEASLGREKRAYRERADLRRRDAQEQRDAERQSGGSSGGRSRLASTLSTAAKVGVAGAGLYGASKGLGAIARKQGHDGPIDWISSLTKSWSDEMDKAERIAAQAGVQTERRMGGIGLTLKAAMLRAQRRLTSVVDMSAKAARAPGQKLSAITAWAKDTAAKAKSEAEIAVRTVKEGAQRAQQLLASGEQTIRLTATQTGERLKRLGLALGAGVTGSGVQQGAMRLGGVAGQLGGRAAGVAGAAGGAGVAAQLSAFHAQAKGALGSGPMSSMETLLAGKGGSAVAGVGAGAAGIALYQGFSRFFNLVREHRDELSMVTGLIRPHAVNAVAGRALGGATSLLSKVPVVGGALGGALGAVPGAQKAAAWTVDHAAKAGASALKHTQLAKAMGLSNKEAEEGEHKFRKFGTALLAVGAFAGWRAFDNIKDRLVGLAKQSVAAAQDIERVGLVLTKIGGSAGYTAPFLKDQVDALKESGIQANVASQSLAEFVKMGINLDQKVSAGGKGGDQKSMISALSRTAQNAAVISGANSSQTLDKLIWGISTGQTDVVRTAGLNVSFENQYAKKAQALKKTVSALTEYEKTEARVQAVLEAGTAIEGAYEQSLENASKRLKSLERVVYDVKAAVGDALNPVFIAGVKIYEGWLKGIERATAVGGTFNSKLKDMATAVGEWMLRMNDSIKTVKGKIRLEPIVATIKEQLGKAFDMKAIMGAGLGAGIATFGSRISGILGMASPLTAWQGAIAGALISNEQFRKDAVVVVGDVIKIFVQLGQAVAPVFTAIDEVLQQHIGEISKIIKAVAEVITAYASMAGMWGQVLATGIRLVANVLGPMASFLESIAKNRAAVATIIAFWAAWKLTEKPRQLLEIATALRLVVQVAEKAGASTFLPGLDKANEKLRGMQASALKMGIATTVASVAAVGLGMAWSIASERARKHQEQVASVWTAYAKSHTAEDTFDKLSAKMDELEGKKGIVSQIPGLDKIASVAGKLARVDPTGFHQNLLKPLVDSSKEQEEIEAHWKVITDLEKKAADALSEYDSQLKSTLGQLHRDAEATGEVLERTLGQAAGKTFDNLTLSQQKKVEQTLTELQQQAANWTQSMTSFSGALLAKEQKDFPSLEAYYDSMYKKIGAFYQNLRKAAQAGLDPAIIQDLLSQGPAIGPALEKWINANEGDIAGAAKKINDMKNKATAPGDAGLRGLGQDILGNAKNFKLDTDQKLKEAIQQRNELADELKKINAVVSNEMAGMGAGSVAGKKVDLIDGTSMSEWQSQLAAFEGMVKDYKTALQVGGPKEQEKAFSKLRASGAETMKMLNDPAQKGVISDIISLLEKGQTLTKDITGLQSDIQTSPISSAQQAEYETMSGQATSAGYTMGANLVNAQVSAINDGATSIQAALKAAWEGGGAAVSGRGAVGGSKPLLDGGGGGIAGWGTKGLQQVAKGKGAPASWFPSSGQGFNEGFSEGESGGISSAAAQEFANNESQFQAYSADRIKMEEGLQKDLAKMERDWGVDRAFAIEDIEFQSYRAREDAAFQFQRSQADAAKGFARQQEDMARSQGRQMADAQRSYYRSIEDMDHNFQKEREHTERDLRDPRRTDQGGLIAEAAQKHVTHMTGQSQARGASRDATQGAAQSMIEAQTKALGPQRAGMITGAINSVVAALQSETQQMVQAGLIGKDLASQTQYLQKRFDEESAALPGLISGTDQWGRSVLSLDEALQRVNDDLDRTINRQMELVDSSMNARDAYYALKQSIEDQRALLTNNLLDEKTQVDIRQRSTRALNDYVRAIEAEAQAKAKTGQIGQDPVSIENYINEKLKEAKTLYPELAALTEQYLASQDNNPLKGAADAAALEIANVKQNLSLLPQSVEVLIQTKLQDLATDQMTQRLDQLEELTRNYSRQLEDMAIQFGQAQEDMAIAYDRSQADMAESYARQQEDISRAEARSIADLDRQQARAIEGRRNQFAKELNDLNVLYGQSVVQRYNTAAGANAGIQRSNAAADASSAALDHNVRSTAQNTMDQAYRSAVYQTRIANSSPWFMGSALRAPIAQPPLINYPAPRIKIGYDEGGYLPPGQHMVENRSGSPEPVFTKGQWAALEPALKAIAEGKGNGGGDVNIENVAIKSDAPSTDWIDEFQRVQMHGVRR